VLFHSGTWCLWRETLQRMPKHRLPSRWVFFDRDFNEL
jgi:hypothetical protein